MATFMYELKLVKGSDGVLDPAEHALIEEHFNYLKNLVREGRVLLAGRCMDAPCGFVIYRAASEQQARDMMDGDPAVAGKVMTAVCHPFRIALIGDPDEFLAHS